MSLGSFCSNLISGTDCHFRFGFVPHHRPMLVAWITSLCHFDTAPYPSALAFLREWLDMWREWILGCSYQNTRREEERTSESNRAFLNVNLALLVFMWGSQLSTNKVVLSTIKVGITKELTAQCVLWGRKTWVAAELVGGLLPKHSLLKACCFLEISIVIGIPIGADS